jgi:hypothetical protein
MTTNGEIPTLRVFVAEGCGECQGIKEGLAQGNITFLGVPDTVEDIDVVDVTTDEGYPFMDSLGIEAIPAAYLGMLPCSIRVLPNEKEYLIDCSPVEEPSGGI